MKMSSPGLAAHTHTFARRIDDTNGTQNVSFRTQNEGHKCKADNNVEAGQDRGRKMRSAAPRGDRSAHVCKVLM